jgi:excisionase family DNA binding protein
LSRKTKRELSSTRPFPSARPHGSLEFYKDFNPKGWSAYGPRRRVAPTIPTNEIYGIWDSGRPRLALHCYLDLPCLRWKNSWQKIRAKEIYYMQPSPEKSLMTVTEAAHFLSISVSTLYGWAWQRRIPFVKVGRALRFERVDLEKFVQSHRYEART